MIQLENLNGRVAGGKIAVRHFPVHIGRAPDCEVRLEEPGVWDRHAVIDLETDGHFSLRVNQPALASINKEPVEHVILRNGDVIELGSGQLRFALSPTRQKSFALREALTWIALAALCLAQVALIYFLDA